MGNLPLVLLLSLAPFMGGCRARDGVRADRQVASTVDASPPMGDCVTAELRNRRVDGAWNQGARTFVCLRSDEYATPKNARDCISVDRTTGLYRRESPSLAIDGGPTSSPKTATLPGSSKSGTIDFVVTGGLRTPHGATQTLIELPSKKSKSAKLDYDEHVELDGFVGDGVVLRTWVEEGPGCVRMLYDPAKRWPLKLGEGVDLGSCYDARNLVFAAPHGRHLFIDGGGFGATFVDDATLSITEVPTDRSITLDVGNLEILAVDDASDRLLLVYGAANGGDVVELDLEARRRAATFSPRICDDAGR